MIYDIDGCESCKKELEIKDVLIEMSRKKLEIQTGRLENAVAYGFKKNQENTRLLLHIKGLERKIREVMEDEKNR